MEGSEDLTLSPPTKRGVNNGKAKASTFIDLLYSCKCCGTKVSIPCYQQQRRDQDKDFIRGINRLCYKLDFIINSTLRKIWKRIKANQIMRYLSFKIKNFEMIERQDFNREIFCSFAFRSTQFPINLMNSTKANLFVWKCRQ